MTNHTFSLDLPYAYGSPDNNGLLRQKPEYFFVEEQLGFDPSGDGEHMFLFVEKTGLNTQQVSERIAAIANIPLRQVSYSGMKDRHAVTRQWFSVHLPGKRSIDWAPLNDTNISLLKSTRHHRKLRRGNHHSNFFRICITNLERDPTSISNTVAKIRQSGFPNYFGEQRFGHNANNLSSAKKWFNGELQPSKHKRGIYLSAIRAWLFNQILAKRVADGSWDKLTDGELLMLDGSQSIFPQVNGDHLEERLTEGDIHLTGPLYGKGFDDIEKLNTSSNVHALESNILSTYPELLAGLEHHGLKVERRSLRVIPKNLVCEFKCQQLILSFSLPKGCFATALMRELVAYRVEHNN